MACTMSSAFPCPEKSSAFVRPAKDEKRSALVRPAKKEKQSIPLLCIIQKSMTPSALFFSFPSEAHLRFNALSPPKLTWDFACFLRFAHLSEFFGSLIIFSLDLPISQPSDLSVFLPFGLSALQSSDFSTFRPFRHPIFRSSDLPVFLPFDFPTSPSSDLLILRLPGLSILQLPDLQTCRFSDLSIFQIIQSLFYDPVTLRSIPGSKLDFLYERRHFTSISIMQFTVSGGLTPFLKPISTALLWQSHHPTVLTSPQGIFITIGWGFPSSSLNLYLK